MRTLALLSAAALAALVLAGCSSSDSTSDSSMSMSDSMAGMHMAKTVQVALQGNKFVNDTVTIYVGDTVQWTNKDSVGHSVTSDSGESFDNKPNCSVGVLPAPACMANGDTFSFTFKKAGTTKYHCRAHSMMTGTIVVLEHGAMPGSMSMSNSASSSSSAPTA